MSGAPLSPLILASGSAIRAKILSDAGIAFTAKKPDVDEGATKTAMADRPAEEVAVALARQKALAVAAPASAVVLGADQMLRLDGALYGKVKDMEAVGTRLRLMRGKTHELISGVCVAQAGVVVDTHVQVSRLTLRAFSEAALEWYLETEGEALLASVGCYRFEGPGVQLFETIEGEYTAILGLPLLATLKMLRNVGAALA